MSTLGTDIGPDTSPIYIPAGLTPGSYPAPYTIDSEAVLVTAGPAAAPYYSVQRGQNGTAPASHSLGATLTVGWGGGGGALSVTGSQGGSAAAVTALQVPGLVSDLGGGAAAVSLLLEKIGPFTVNFSDSSPVHLVDIAANVRIANARCYILTPWDHDADTSYAALQADTNPPSDARELWRWYIGANWANGNSAVFKPNAFQDMGSNAGPAGVNEIISSQDRGGVFTADGALYLVTNPGVGTPTAGTIEIEIDIATDS